MKAFTLLMALIAFLFQLSVADILSKTGQLHRTNRKISRGLFYSLEELARIVDISYCVGSTGIYKPFQCLSRCNEFESFELVTTWNTGPFLSDSCGYIALSHSRLAKRIIVAFRGTYSLANMILDLSVDAQAYIPFMGDGDGNETSRCLNCTVHAGFLTSWHNTRPILIQHISEIRQQYPDYKLVLVGHSLGGAVATLAGLDMLLRGWDPQVTTFGQPMVGNDAFVEFLDEAFNLTNTQDPSGLKFRRVTHVNDPVPLLPLEEWGYKMHAGEIFISKQHLPPSISDVELCDGGRDPRCIAGTGSSRIMVNELKDIARNEVHYSKLEHPLGQNVLSNNRQDPGSIDDRRHTLSRALSNPIPGRFRLWELLFAHRDYFSRLGLCVPGGDPTGLAMESA